MSKKDDKLDLKLELFDWHGLVVQLAKANKEVQECGPKDTFQFLDMILSEKEKQTVMDFCNFLFDHTGGIEVTEVIPITKEEMEALLKKKGLK